MNNNITEGEYMLKVYCDNCRATGHVYSKRTETNSLECASCQGKGYTELEPESIFESGAIKTNATITLNGGYRKFEVYIKESKSE